MSALAAAASPALIASKRAAPAAGPAQANAMQVWSPLNNKFFETFSFLPPLTDAQISKQVEYLVYNGLTPSLEFAESGTAYAKSHSELDSCSSSGMYENRYWSMWKLPMFGCQDPSQVLNEIAACRRAFPNCFVRLVGFDAVRQVQSTGMLVQRPMDDDSYIRDVSKRSLY